MPTRVIILPCNRPLNSIDSSIVSPNTYRNIVDSYEVPTFPVALETTVLNQEPRRVRDEYNITYDESGDFYMRRRE